MAERETEYLFYPYGNHITIRGTYFPQRVKVNNERACRVMVNEKLVYEGHDKYSWDPIPTEKNGKKNGTHTGRCYNCGSIQTEPHSGEDVPVYDSSTDNHKYLCKKFDTNKRRCSGFYLEKHNKKYSGLGDSNRGDFSLVRHRVSCETCGKNGEESHKGEKDDQGKDKGKYHNDAMHKQICTICGQGKYKEHGYSKDYSQINVYKHKVTCKTCSGSGEEDHDGEKYNGLDKGRYEKSDSKCKTHHRQKCKKCGGFRYEVHNYPSTYTKSGSEFKGNCTECTAADSIAKGSIGYGSVPCGDGNYMDIQLEYNADKGKLRFKIFDGEYPLIYEGSGKVPNDEKGAIHVGNGGYKRAKGKGPSASGSKEYEYRKHFTLSGKKGRGGIFEGTPSKGYTSVVDYQAYCSTKGDYNFEFSYSMPVGSDSKTKIDTKNSASKDGYCYFYQGGFSDLTINSNDIEPFRYLIFPYKKGWHGGKKRLVNAIAINKNCTIKVG